MKPKIALAFLAVVAIALCSGITYSAFYQTIPASSGDQKIAAFVFDAEPLDHVEVNISDLLPGSEESYKFSVANNSLLSSSDVTIEYQITLKTMHVIPTSIKLYKEVNGEDVLQMTCDETYSRIDNELVCNTDTFEMAYSENNSDLYNLVVLYDDSYNDPAYADSIDYLDLSIKSWQKVTK